MQLRMRNHCSENITIAIAHSRTKNILNSASRKITFASRHALQSKRVPTKYIAMLLASEDLRFTTGNLSIRTRLCSKYSTIEQEWRCEETRRKLRPARLKSFKKKRYWRSQKCGPDAKRTFHHFHPPNPLLRPETQHSLDQPHQSHYLELRKPTWISSHAQEKTFKKSQFYEFTRNRHCNGLWKPG